MNSREIKGKLLLGKEQAVEALCDLLKKKVVSIATVEGRKDMMQYFNVGAGDSIKREFFMDESLSVNIGKAINKLSAQGQVVYRLKFAGETTCNTFSCCLEELKMFRKKRIVEKVIDILVIAGVINRDQCSELIGMDISELRAYMLGLEYHENVNGSEYWRKLFTQQLDYICKQYEIVVA